MSRKLFTGDNQEGKKFDQENHKAKKIPVRTSFPVTYFFCAYIELLLTESFKNKYKH